MRLTTYRRCLPAIPLGSLALVNDHEVASSDSSLSNEDVGVRQSNTSYYEDFGDNISIKKENTLRVGFQNIGGFLKSRTKFKEEII